MNGRIKLSLLIAFLAAAYVLGQPPLDDRIVLPVSPPENGLQPVQNLEFPVLTRPGGRGQQPNGYLMSQPIPMPLVNTGEIRSALVGIPPQPPTPAVSIAVLVPSDYPPNEDIPCTIRVSNNSGGDAHKVVVRISETPGATVVSANSTPIPAGNSWNLNTMKAGATEKIELKLKPVLGSGGVSVKAFVSCEHGQVVKTNISDRKLKVKTELPKLAIAEEPIPVRVTIRNDGRVPITGAKLVQTISEGFDFHKDIATGTPTTQKNQRSWNLGTISAGEQKTLQYLLTAGKGRALSVMSVVDTENKITANDTTSVQVGESQLRVLMTGDGKADEKQNAYYEVEVANTGTVPLTNVRVNGTIPEDCRLTRVTRGGREYRGMVSWIIEKLAPGEKQSYRWGLQSTGGSRKQIRANADAGRGVEDSKLVETFFPGSADLHWETRFDNPTVTVDRQGLMTIRVKNTGTDSATNVRLSVEIPKDVVSFVQATPNAKQVGEMVQFDARNIAAGKTEEYTITFRGEQYGRAVFNAKLAADLLGDRPEGAVKYVEVVRKP
jgi:uncharacterized repeat protein (TIGR01451 family)